MEAYLICFEGSWRPYERNPTCFQAIMAPADAHLQGACALYFETTVACARTRTVNTRGSVDALVTVQGAMNTGNIAGSGEYS